MKLNLKKELTLFSICLLPLIYLFIVWAQLPNEVAIHYNFSGEADKFASKTAMIFISGISLLTYCIFLIIPVIDPKKQIDNMGNKFFHIRFITIFFISTLMIFLIYKTINESTPIQFLMVIIGLFFVALGNYFQTIKPNYFIGIRTPWTLQNEEVWMKTHKKSGKIWIICGFITAIAYFIFPLNIASVLMIALIIIMLIIPLMMSYFLFQKVSTVKN